MKHAIILSLSLAAALACSAAHAEIDEAKLNHRLDRLQTELKLSEQQKQEVGKIFEETKPQLEALRKQGEELRAKMKERLRAVLTAEQMDKFEKMRQERRTQRRMGRFGPPPQGDN
ncbi:MAG: hypothetical protein ACKN9T_04960 [Candidatus Methylumidiphilus sp.]